MGGNPTPGTSGRRQEVLALLRESRTTWDINAIAHRLAVHPNTVRFHLDALAAGRDAWREVLGETEVSVMGRTWPALHVSMGNPHAVAYVDNLAEAGPLLEPPEHDDGVYPDGVNVEFVVRRGERHVAMRVHERGSGETRSCGTGACAVMVAVAIGDGVVGPPAEDLSYRVDVPGGSLTVTWTVDDRVLLTGPAVLVAAGTTDL